MAILNITLPEGASICNGKQVTFRAPCDCNGVTGIVIDGVTYQLLNTADKPVGDSDAFVSGAIVSVMMDTDNKIAYVQNGSAGMEYVKKEQLGTFTYLIDETLNAEAKVEMGLSESATPNDAFLAIHESLGKKLEKSEAISDETRRLYGLGPDAVPDDVLKTASTKIGEIKSTVRTDLGDTWLLCNGESILPKEYPDIAELMKYNWTFNTDIYTKTDIVSGDAAWYPSPLAYINGKWVIMYPDTNGTLHVAIRGDDGLWVKHATTGLFTVSTSSSSGSGATDVRIKWLDGRYVLFRVGSNHYVNCNTKTLTLYESDNLINWNELSVSITPWSSDVLAGANGYYVKNILASDNGTYIMTAKRSGSNYNHITYGISTSIEGPFVFQEDPTIWSLDDDTSTFTSSYANGKFFMAGANSSSNMLVAFYDTISGTATKVLIKATNTNGAFDVQYIDDYYVFANNTDCALYVSKDALTWESISYTSLGKSFSLVGKVPYQNENQLLVWHYTNNVTDSLTVDIVDLETKTFTNILKNKSLELNYGGMRTKLLTNDGVKMTEFDNATKSVSIIEYDTHDMLKLPAISLDSVYTYIKVLEG